MKSRLAKKVLACIASAAVLVTPVYAIDVKVYDECVSVSGTIKAAKSGEKVTVSVLPQGESWDGISQTGEIQKDVSFLGVIGFVGVICPHAVKKLLGQDHRHTVTASALAGSLLLLLADTVSRSLGSGSALPVGAITSLLGAPFFLAVIFSRGGDGEC